MRPVPVPVPPSVFSVCARECYYEWYDVYRYKTRRLLTPPPFVSVPPPPSCIFSFTAQGLVYLKFESTDAGRACGKAMHGRFFNKHCVAVQFFPAKTYSMRFPTAQ